MTTAIITWALPTVRSDGSPQDPNLLDFVATGFSADGGANFTDFGNILSGDEQKLTIPDLVDGGYIVRLQVFDTDGKFGVTVDTAIAISLSNPGAVTNVVVDLS